MALVSHGRLSAGCLLLLLPALSCPRGFSAEPAGWAKSKEVIFLLLTSVAFPNTPWPL